MRRLLPLALVVIGAAACGDTTADDAAEGEAGCETITVEIPEFAFDPTPVEIDACDSVVWKNTHTQAHTSTGKGDKAWSTGNLSAGSTSDPVRFDDPGSFAYICALHPFMQGVVDVA